MSNTPNSKGKLRHYSKVAWYEVFVKRALGWESIKKIAWVSQLLEASKLGGRSSTLLASFFVNVLSLVFPLMLMQVYDRIIPNRSFETLTFLTIGVFVAVVFEVTLRIARAYVNLWTDTKYEYGLSKDAFEKLLYTPLLIFEKMGAGARLKQLGTLDQMKGFYNNQLMSAVFDAPYVVIFLGVMAYIGHWLFLVPLITIIVMTYASFVFIKHSEDIMYEKLNHEAHENNFIIDVLSNIHTVKSMNMESLMVRRYEKLQTSSTNINYLSSVEAGDLIVLKMVANQALTILLVVFGALYVIHGQMAIGGLAACTLLSSRIMQPMMRALTAFNRWKSIDIVRDQLLELLALPSEERAAAPEFGELQGDIELKNLSFRYESDTPWILKEINCAIPHGSVVGVIGSDQSGKTTLLNILTGLIEPTDGEYFLDGRNVFDYQTSGVRKQIAYLGHSGKLFRGTIMENLTGFDDTLVPVAKRLSEMLGLHPIITKLPNGYDTIVGDRAVDSLPRGVVNRIMIARSLVNKPKIVLFDEANINLDVQSNQQLIDLLISYKKIATVIIVSKRKELIDVAEIVYALNEGRLVQVINEKPA